MSPRAAASLLMESALEQDRASPGSPRAVVGERWPRLDPRQGRTTAPAKAKRWRRRPRPA